MNRSKKSPKSPTLEESGDGTDNAGSSAKLPPNGRQKIPNKNSSSVEPVLSSANSTNSTGSGEKKKKFSFFSNLFKSKIPEGSSAEASEGMASSSSYESVNSLASTNSFTFVSSKKFKRKGHKGKRIPVDETTLPRPSSSCNNNNNTRTETISTGGGTLGRGVTAGSSSAGSKKLSTLGRIGMKMGLKKKYNLQSCESLEHIASLPKPLNGRKSQTKSNGAVSPTSSVIVEGEGFEVVQNAEQELTISSPVVLSSSKPLTSTHVNETLTDTTQSTSQLKLQINPSSETNISEISKLENDTSITALTCSNNVTITANGDSSSVITSQDPLPETPSTSTAYPSSPGPSSSGLSLSEYTSDPSTWSNSTRIKRRAPPPPSKAGPSMAIENTAGHFSGNVVVNASDEKGEKNVELKFVRRLDENEVLGSKNDGKVTYPSYPSGALRRNKSKEKSHNRPYSCTCTTSIFAHHSKYQQYHKRSCSDEPHAHGGSENKCSTSNYNTNSMTRAHVKGKKKAPAPPPNPFESAEIKEEISTLARNPENPYGNPFLDDNRDGNSHINSSEGTKTAQVPVTLSSENVSEPAEIHVVQPPVPTTADSNNSREMPPTKTPKILSASTSVPSTTTTLVSNSLPIVSLIQPTTIDETNATISASVSSSDANTSDLATNFITVDDSTPEFVPLDEITQNMLNDSHEQEQLASAQNTASSLNEASTQHSTSITTTTELSPSFNTKQSSTTNAANAKRLFNLSKNINSNPHLQEERQNEFQVLLNSSPTLKAQARVVDDQVKAQLVTSTKNDKEKRSSSFFSKPKKNTSLEIPSANEAGGSSSASLSPPPLSPKSPSPSKNDSTKVAPRPWYKRGNSSSKSPTGTNKVKIPIKPTITHLPKFSDLDREAKQIVEENKRKSAELAFNRNARDLINIFNTSFSSSSSTSTVTATNSNNAISSTKTTTMTTISPISPTSCAPTNNKPSTFTSTVSNSSTTATTTSTSFISASRALSSSGEQRSIAVVQPHKSLSNSICTTTVTNSSSVSASVTTTVSTLTSCASTFSTILSHATTASVSPCIRQTSSTQTKPVSITSNLRVFTKTSTSNSQPKVTSTSSNVLSSLSSSPTVPNSVIITLPSTSKSTDSSTTTTTNTTKSLEDWQCPRCTLKNPSWKALCDACYFRKFPLVINPSSCATTTTTTTTTVANRISNAPTATTNSASFSNPSANVSFIRTENVSAVEPQPEKNKGIESSPPTEILLNQLSAKKVLCKDEKQQEINELSSAENTDGDVDVEKLRQARLAFFAKDQQDNEHGLNINVNNEKTTSSTPSPSCNSNNNNITQNQQPNNNALKDINKLVLPPKRSQQNPPERPPKPSSSNSIPNFDLLLPQQGQNSVVSQSTPASYSLPQFQGTTSPAPQQLRPLSPPPPTFAYRPLLAPISETDQNYYSIQEVHHLYENWQQSLENESLHSSPTNHLSFNIASPNLAFANNSISNTNAAVHPFMPLQMRQHFANMPDTLTSPTFANFNFRPFTPIPNITPIQAHTSAGTGFDPSSAFVSNSHSLNSGFTSESETEVDLDIDNIMADRQHHRSGGGRRGHNRDRDRQFNSREAYSGGERRLSYDDYRRLGAIPKGYSGSGSDHDERRFGSGSGHRRSSELTSQRYRDSDPRYYADPSENSVVGENPLEVSKLIRKLEWAIAQGEHRLAASLAHDLALLKVNCVVAKPNLDPITIRVYVEDRFMQQGPFLVQVLPTMTLKDLKSKIEGDWGIPAGFQKWILGKKMAEDDNETLANYDVVNDTMAFLYLVTPQIQSLGVKIKANSPPPPPLPKKPTSPSVSRPLSLVDASTTESHQPNPQQTQPTNQLQSLSVQPKISKAAALSDSEKNAVEKVTSSCQTEKVEAFKEPIKKSPMPEPTDTKDDVIDIESQPLVVSPINLYERPSSPSREDKNKLTPISEKVFSKETRTQPSDGLSPSRPNTSTIAPSAILSEFANKNEEHKASSRASVTSVPISSQNISATTSNRTSPIPVAHNFPLSLQAKLANLRQAAEQAFGKSFGQQLQQQLINASATTTNSSSSNNQQPRVQKSVNTSQSKFQNAPSKTTPPPMIEKLDPSNKGEVKTQISPKLTASKASETKKPCHPNPDPVKSIAAKMCAKDPNRKNKQAVLCEEDRLSKSPTFPTIDQSFSTSSTQKDHKISSTEVIICTTEPTPTPRSKKQSNLDTESDILSDATESLKTLNIITPTETREELQVKVTETPKCEEKILNTKLRVEGSCQTTLPFPSTSKSKAVSTASPTTSPTPKPSSSTLQSPAPSSTSPQPQGAQSSFERSDDASKSGHKPKDSTVIVANVMITPFITHALLGATALLQGALAPLSAINSPSPIITEDTRRNTSSPSTSDLLPVVLPSDSCKSIIIDTNTEATLKTFCPTPKCSKTTEKTDVFPSTSSQISTETPFLPKMAPVVLRNPVKNSKGKPYQLPYFMKEEPEPNKTQPSKVKMIARKFSTPNEVQSKPSLQRKNSDGSTINLAISSPISNGIGNRAPVQGAVGISSDKKESNIQTYLNMLQMMEKQNLIMSVEEFECPVCFSLVQPEMGVTLRDCLHNFCKDCLIGAVEYAEESEVKCPFRDDNYSCTSSLQEREIKALVPPQIFEKYLTRSLKLAERKMMNTFHCKTTDCLGWCIFEDDVNIFKCPVCKAKNCITCAAIHEGTDCQQYQRQLAIAAETDEDAKSSRLMLERLIQRGEALECPHCKVVLLKKWGCDWVKCSYCKTEICWVTKGLRWGPNGKGDTSGGCKCGVNGIRCHVKCTYCH